MCQGLAMNLPLSADRRLIEKAPHFAHTQGCSLNGLFRDFLHALVADGDQPDMLAQLQSLWEQSSGDSGGRQWRREDAYEDRL